MIVFPSDVRHDDASVRQPSAYPIVTVMITTEETGISPWKTSHMRIVNIALDGSIVIENCHIILVVINIAAAQVQFACIQIFCTAVIHASDFQHLHIPETPHLGFSLYARRL